MVLVRSAVAFLLFTIAVTPAVAEVAAPRVVEVGLFLIDIANLDEQNETYAAEFDVIARWKNTELAFNPRPDEEIPRLLTGSEASDFLENNWNPGLFAINVVDDSSVRQLRILLFPDGTVTLRSRVRRTLRAQMDFHWFPFDSQTLPVFIESLLYDSDEIHLEVENEFTGFDQMFEVSEWSLTDLTTASQVRERVQEGQNYDRLSFLMRIERQRGHYIWKIVLPMIIIVVLSWIVFWMSAEPLGRRAGVSSTGMLTIIAYQFLVSDSLPRYSYQTILDHFMLASLLAIAATMVINLINSRLEEQTRYRLDRICRLVFPVFYFLAIAVVLIRGLRGGG